MRQFLRGRNVFLTGATGFLGKALLHKLLSQAEVGTVFVLLRAKKGRSPGERLLDLLGDPVFEAVGGERAARVGRVKVVAGDVGEPRMGMEPEDVAAVASSVSVVFHAAATVRFDAPMSDAVRTNVEGTRHLLRVAREMPSLLALVHVSTAFTHCHLGPEEEVEERLYGEEGLEADDPRLCGRPNTYTLTKAMAEVLLLDDEFSSLPTVVVRPSIVVAARKTPFPGWIDNYNGATGEY